MPAPDPHALLTTAARHLGTTAPAHPVLRPARGEGDWYSPLAHRLPEAGPAPKVATALATALGALPEVSWAASRGPGVLFAVHSAGLAAHLDPRLGERTPAAAGAAHQDRNGSQEGTARSRWPADLYPVAFAHARSRNLTRAAAAHGVPAPADPATDPDTTHVLAEPHARALVVRVATLATTPQMEPLLLRETADLFQHWFAAMRLTPRGPEPVTSYHRIRLAVNNATASALATGLSALGLDAPEHL